MENKALPYNRKDVETGLTKKKLVACTNLYITINHDEHNNLIEAFIRPSKRGGCEANLEAVGRLISLALRYKIPLVEIINQLRGIRCKSCTNYIASDKHKEKPIHYSCPDAVARALGNADNYFKNEK
jgi:ribonucleoside-diphosphate reductase alpha chain